LQDVSPFRFFLLILSRVAGSTHMVVPLRSLIKAIAFL